MPEKFFQVHCKKHEVRLHQRINKHKKRKEATKAAKPQLLKNPKEHPSGKAQPVGAKRKSRFRGQAMNVLN